MRPTEYLMRRLPKVMNDPNRSQPLYRIVNIVDILGALVRQVMEDIDCFNGGIAFLLAPEYQIDPVVQVLRHVGALEAFATE